MFANREFPDSALATKKSYELSISIVRKPKESAKAIIAMLTITISGTSGHGMANRKNMKRLERVAFMAISRYRVWARESSSAAE